MLFSFDPNNYNQAVYDYCLNVAKEKKLWAEQKNKELDGKPWSNASEVSQKMLKDYTEQTIEELAIDKYKYLRLRSHSFHDTFPIDKPSFELWTKLTGIEPTFGSVKSK